MVRTSGQDKHVTGLLESRQALCQLKGDSKYARPARTRWLLLGDGCLLAESRPWQEWEGFDTWLCKGTTDATADAAWESQRVAVWDSSWAMPDVAELEREDKMLHRSDTLHEVHEGACPNCCTSESVLARPTSNA